MLGLALAAQLVYLGIRFRWTFGAGAVAALFGNVAVVTGVFAWLGRPLDGVFLAALLTIIGYTVNDSVIVFDRIREVWAAQRSRPFRRVVSIAAPLAVELESRRGASPPVPKRPASPRRSGGAVV